MESLESGDAIMADRGFLIDEEAKVKGIRLICPAFQHPNRVQLSVEKVYSTWRIAEPRIHVERAIGRTKQFKILDGYVPLSMKPILGRLFAMCVFLANFQTPILPLSASTETE